MRPAPPRRARRAAALALVLALAPALATACGSDGGSGDDGGANGCFTLADGACVVETFESPPVLAPNADGVHELTLAATEVVVAGQRHCVRAYNGAWPGPTLETPARSGDAPRQVRVDLVNALGDHALRSLNGGACTCTTSAGASCQPAHLHDACAHAEEGEDCTCRDEDGEVCEHLFDFNVTNLHAHGAHARPDYARGGDACQPRTVDGLPVLCRECGPDVCDGDASDDACYHGDNVLNAVHPGTGARYRWDIDEDGTHHTGLQWYHPHIHGTTAIQVASGAAGAWIVRGPLDALDGVAGARERVMLFNTPPIGKGGGFEPLADGEACTDETLTFDDFFPLGDFTARQLNLLNGRHRPRMVTPPGQVERWRIVHAGFLDEVFFGVFRGTDSNCSGWSTADADTLTFTQIGRDGLILPQAFESDYLFMSPGYRIEALLGGEGRLADGETWCLVAARALQEANPERFGVFGEQPMSPPVPPTPEELVARFDGGDLVAILNVTASAGAPTETALPDLAAVAALAPSMDLGGVPIQDRCAAAAAVTDPAGIDQAAVLQVGFFTVDDPDPCDCAGYNVNCHNFEETDRSVYPFDRDLPLDAIEHWRIGASVDGHPFHIHINPFVVCPNDNVFDPLPFPHWRDTYLVNMGRRVDLVTQNRAFTGPYVFHCHKLTHEDHGMMQVVRVCDPATDATCGDYGWRVCAAGDEQCAKALAATDCAIGATTEPQAAACAASLGAPGAACGPGLCTGDAECPDAARCDAGQCVPAPCVPPCGPGSACVHGSCE